MEKIYLSKDVKKILEKIDYSRLGERVAIKVHFGEKGCITYINPDLVRDVYDKMISLGKRTSLVECNVLYRGSRINTKEHVKLAKEHGFDFAPIDILDGEKGEKFIEVSLEKGLVKNVKLGKGLKKYDSMIVLTHFKGHEMAGFGGAFKNIGMGLGSRAGKLQMHSDISPLINLKRCTGCETCIKHCNANAISLVNEKAKIDQEKCEGCAMCIAVCLEKAVKVPWGCSTSEQLQKKIIDYSEGVMKLMKNKIIFINVLENITENCDCMDSEQEPIIKDIGILMGDDIVAIDKASLDLIKERGKDFGGEVQIDYAVEKGLGNKEYEIVDLDE